MTTPINLRSVARLAAMLMACSLFVAGIAMPAASADPPVEFEITNVFPATNPCTGTAHVVTIHRAVRLHQHDNGNVIAHEQRTGSTDDGYVMDHGVFNFVDNGNIVRRALNDNWRNADGSMFKAQGVAVFDIASGELRVDNFRLRCVAG